MNRLLWVFVMLLVLLVSMSLFAEERSSEAPAGQNAETKTPASAPPAEEYKFEPSEIEKKPYHIGGYLEFRPILYGLDKEAAIYKLKFFNHDVGNTTEDYDGRLWLEGSYEKGIVGFFVKGNLELDHTYQGWNNQTKIYEGYGSLKPSSSLTIDLGKRVFNWGKGYAWNPVAFVDRPKDPDDPELPREGYIATTADYIKSFSGPLKTLSLSPVIFPAYHRVNDDFVQQQKNLYGMNFAGRLYALLYDTDIDFLFFMGASKSNRFGMDFSRNITTDLEIHGEFAYVRDQQRTSVDANGNTLQTKYDAVSSLLGLRYMFYKPFTYAADTTVIFEYYHNATGFSHSQLQGFYSFSNTAFDTFLSSGKTQQLSKAESLLQGGYGGMNPGKDYLYLRIYQDQPFNILYFTPALTTIMNLNDRSLSISPEVLYTGIKNWEFRLKGMALAGSKGTDFGVKQNDYRIEFRVRYYFSLP